MSESCPIYEWVMAHISVSHVPYMSESCLYMNFGMCTHKDKSVVSHLWVSHAPYMSESCPMYELSHVSYIDESCPIYRWVMSHIWVSHVSYMNFGLHPQGQISRVSYMSESSLIYEWVMSHIWVSHGSYMSESCPTYEWVMPNIWVSHAQHMSESWLTYRWVMSHIWVSRVSYMNFGLHNYRNKLVVSHIWVSHVSYMREWCLIYAWVMSHIWVSHVSYIGESCPIHRWIMSHIWVSHVSYMNLNFACITQGQISRVSHMSESWLIYEWVMAHIWVSHISYMDFGSTPKWSVTSKCAISSIILVSSQCHASQLSTHTVYLINAPSMRVATCVQKCEMHDTDLRPKWSTKQKTWVQNTIILISSLWHASRLALQHTATHCNTIQDTHSQVLCRRSFLTRVSVVHHNFQPILCFWSMRRQCVFQCAFGTTKKNWF